MKAPILFSSDSTPPRFMSIQGLSSPFRDRPVTLTVSSHIIDISPSPPPPVIATLSGRFEDALSPGLDSPTETHLIDEVDQRGKLSSVEPTSHHERQPIGLGLGIDTGEGTFANFPLASDETHESYQEETPRLAKKIIVRSVAARLLSRRSKPSPLRASFGNREALDGWEAQEYLIEDGGREKEADNIEYHEPHGRYLGLKGSTAKSKPLKNTPSLVVKSLPEALPSTPHKKIVESENSPLTPQIAARGLRLSEAGLVGDGFAPEKNGLGLEPIPLQRRIVELQESHPTTAKGSLLMTLSARGKLFGTLRLRIRGRETDESDETLKASLAASQKAAHGPSLIEAGVPSPASLGQTYSPVFSGSLHARNDQPLGLPPSPAFATHSPTLRATPGSFSPLMHDSKAYSPSMVNVAHGMPTHAGATTIVFSVLAGSLGLFGMALILFAIFWKRSEGKPGFSFWRRKPRGTAYDEFMEEKIWWMADKKIQIHRQRKPSLKNLIAEADEKSDACSLKDEDDRATQVTRSTSQAPSIPPLAHIVDGKFSIDSLRLEFPSPSSTISSFSSGSSGNYEDHFRDREYDLANKFKTRPASEKSTVPQEIDTLEDKNLANRTRSDSRSTTLSKASLKSISSIASFIMSMTKFDSSSSGKKKGKVELGISSEDYKNRHESLNSMDDPFSKASPKCTKKGSKGTLNQPTKRLDSHGSPIRPASVHLEKFDYSPGSPEAPKRPKTMSFITPAILITDHPSELIPPSPPRSSTYSQRPESLGSFLSRYTSSNNRLDYHLSLHESDLSNSKPFSEEFSTALSNPNIYDGPTIPQSAASRVERSPSPRSSVLTSRLDWAAKDPSINLISNGLGNWSPRQTLDLSTAAFDPSMKRSSLNTVNSAQAIRDLAAVTEDLRILIDSELDPDSSWDSPSQFHQSIPDWVTLPTSSFPVKPPMRPPKSASRYSNRKPIAIEFESASLPCSPDDASPMIGSQYPDEYRSLSSSSRVLSAAKHKTGQTSRSTSTSKKKRIAPGSQVPKSNSDSSIDTALSTGSNASLFEIGSLHTAQSVRGASAEFVARQSILQSIEAYNRLRMSTGDAIIQ